MATSTGINRRTFLGSSLAGAAGVFLLGGCGSSSPGATGGSGAASGSGSGYSGQLSVPLYTELPDNAVYIVGFKKGFFTQDQLALKPVNFLQGSDVIRNVMSSSHLGVSSPISGLVAMSTGLSQIRIVGTCLNRPTVYFMVKPDSSIHSVADLKGKKIGVNSPTSITNYLCTKVVESAGLDPHSDVDMIDVKSAGEAATALATGVVDCAWSTPPLSVQLVQEGKMRQLIDTPAMFPNFTQTVLFTDAGFLKSNADVIKRFIEATAKSQAFIRNHTEEASAIYAAKLGIKPTIAHGTLQKLAPGYTIDFSHTGFNLNIEACQKLGLLKKPIAYDQIVDDRYASAV